MYRKFVPNPVKKAALSNQMLNKEATTKSDIVNEVRAAEDNL